jgi:hypothetical protein
MKNEENKIEISVSPEYIKNMQTEGMYAKLEGCPAEFPHCPYYMQGYSSVK